VKFDSVPSNLNSPTFKKGFFFIS